MKKVIGIALFLFLLNPLFGTIYYVDKTTGDDGDSGQTEELAWETIDRVNNDDFSAGDFVKFKRGEVWREQLNFPSSGSSGAGNQITITCYGEGNLPKIYGSAEIATWSDEGSDIWSAACAADPVTVFFVNTDESVTWGIEEAAKVDVDTEYEWWWDDPNDKLFVFATSDPDTRYSSVEKGARTRCVSISGKNYLTLENFEVAFTNNSWPGVPIYVGTSSYITIDSNTVHHTGKKSTGPYGDGIDIENSTNCTISNNTIHNTGLHGVYLIASDGNDCTDHTLESNEMYDCYYSGIDANALAANSEVSSVIIRYNKIYHTANFDTAHTAAGMLLQCEPAGVITEDFDIYYNTLYNIRGNFISVSRNTNNFNIYNNICGSTFSGYTGSSIGFDIGMAADTTTNVVLKNNVGFDCYTACFTAIDSAVVSACDNNCWYQSSRPNYVIVYDLGNSPYTSAEFATYKSESGWDASALWEDPKFVDKTSNDYRLLMASPCVNAGADVSLTRDHRGRSIRHAPDMGAYEDPTNTLFW